MIFNVFDLKESGEQQTLEKKENRDNKDNLKINPSIYLKLCLANTREVLGH